MDDIEVRPGLPAERARRVRLVVLDVDGVLTDNGVYIGAAPDGSAVEMKRFDIQDGLGVKMLVWAGIRVVLVSGRESQATRIRAAELGVESYQSDGGYKLPTVDRILASAGVTWEEVAAVCDDLADLAVVRRAGLPVAVRNAVTEVRAAAVWSTVRRGGSGAVREFAEALLKARGEWADQVERYVEEREMGGRQDEQRES